MADEALMRKYELSRKGLRSMLVKLRGKGLVSAKVI
jgi:DNA-binding GntR family transcriptional regulator